MKEKIKFKIGDYDKERCCESLCNAMEKYLSWYDDADLIEFVANVIRDHKKKERNNECSD